MKYENGLIPCLFDRLTDHTPRSSNDVNFNRSISIHSYRQEILRDILFLLNTTCLHSDELDLELPSEVKKSTLNYGIPAFSGVNISDIDWVDVEKSILSAINYFEPRLDTATLKVITHFENEHYTNHNQLFIEIKGMIKLNPFPREFWLKTTIDVETGLFSLIDGNINE